MKPWDYSIQLENRKIVPAGLIWKAGQNLGRRPRVAHIIASLPPYDMLDIMARQAVLHSNL